MRFAFLLFTSLCIFSGRTLADLPVDTGLWGGKGIYIKVGSSSSIVELDCAHGTISEQFATNKHGRFQLTGTFTVEDVGPTDPTHPPVDRPARYVGKVRGNFMLIRIVLTDTGRVAGPYVLGLDQPFFVTKCL